MFVLNGKGGNNKWSQLHVTILINCSCLSCLLMVNLLVVEAGCLSDCPSWRMNLNMERLSLSFNRIFDAGCFAFGAETGERNTDCAWKEQEATSVCLFFFLLPQQYPSSRMTRMQEINEGKGRNVLSQSRISSFSSSGTALSCILSFPASPSIGSPFPSLFSFDGSDTDNSKHSNRWTLDYYWFRINIAVL